MQSGYAYSIVALRIKLLFELHKDVTYPFPHLAITTEGGDKFVALTKAEFWTIGRGYNNTIVLDDKWASRNHATIQIIGKVVGQVAERTDRHIPHIPESTESHTNQSSEQTFGSTESKSHNITLLNTLPEKEKEVSGNFYLVDLSSRNGSFVNGNRSISPVMLKHGDRLILGRTEMVFQHPNQQTLLQIFPSELLDTPTAPHQNFGLTPSEEKVFRQVVRGLTNKEIGKRLQVSPRTVQTHLSSIMTKLNLDNRSQIVRFAFEHGYHPLDTTEL